MPPIPAPLLCALETVVVTALVPLIGYWLDPTDPLFLQKHFPWLLIAPLLSGLRYGFAYGFGSALSCCVAIAVGWRMDLLPVPGFPTTFAVGLMAVGMIAGEFADMWIRRVRRLSVISDYRRVRLEEFARGYHLLKMSHDTLEQKIAGVTPNLRESLMTLRRELSQADYTTAGPLFGLEKRIMTIYSSYGWIQIGVLLAVDEHGALIPEPLATLGGNVSIDPNDTLIAEALTTGMLASIRAENVSEATKTNLLAAIPLTDVQGHCWAVLAVQHMPFVAFHEENLRMLAVLGGHIADILTHGARSFLGEATALDQFIIPVQRTIEDARHHGLPAGLVALSFQQTRVAEALVKQIISQRRGLDQALTLKNRQGNPVVFVLLCLTDEAGQAGYLTRLERIVRERYGTSLEEAGISVHSIILTKRHNAKAVLADLCQRCEVDEAAPLPPPPP